MLCEQIGQIAQRTQPRAADLLFVYATHCPVCLRIPQTPSKQSRARLLQHDVGSCPALPAYCQDLPGLFENEAASDGLELDASFHVVSLVSDFLWWNIPLSANCRHLADSNSRGSIEIADVALTCCTLQANSVPEAICSAVTF